jgi:hypothetical protein
LPQEVTLVKLTLSVLSALTLVSLAPCQEKFTFVGTIDKVSRNELTIRTSRGPVKMFANRTTEVVKDKSYHDFAPLKTGDEISVQCQPDASGKLVAVKVWANVVSFPATVKELRGEEIEVAVTNDETGGGGDQRKIVRFYPDTIFGTNRADLSVGQRVRIGGLDVGNGVVDAARIALYNTDVPVVGKQK